MKKIFYSLVVVFFMVAVSCNQGSNSGSTFMNGGDRGGMGPGNFDPEAMIDRQMDQMKETLELTGDQEDQIRDILVKGSENMQAMREEMREGGGGFEGMRESMQQMREEQDSKIKEILSEEQWLSYEAMQEEMRSRRGQRPQQN